MTIDPASSNQPLSDETLDLDTLVDLMRQMAHDMRGPLGALTGTADMLVSGAYGELNAKQERATARAQRNSYRVLALLNDMMIYVKAETGRLEQKPEPFDPGQLLRDVYSEVLSEVQARGLTFELTGIDDLPETVVAIPALVRRIILAMAWNAVIFSSPGTISLHTEWHPELAIWNVSVRDNGPGIAPENLPQIYNPLWRGEDRFQGPLSTSGFGMGLAIAQSLTRCLGGTFSLAETTEAGSVFTFSLPCTING